MPPRPFRNPLRCAALAISLGLAAMSMSSCVWHQHTVGLGPNAIGTESARQFYILFGLLRLNEVDSQRMTHDLRSYRVTTSFSLVDFLLTPILLPLLGTTSRTVVVER